MYSHNWNLHSFNSRGKTDLQPNGLRRSFTTGCLSVTLKIMWSCSTCLKFSFLGLTPTSTTPIYPSFDPWGVAHRFTIMTYENPSPLMTHTHSWPLPTDGWEWRLETLGVTSPGVWASTYKLDCPSRESSIWLYVDVVRVSTPGNTYSFDLI